MSGVWRSVENTSVYDQNGFWETASSSEIREINFRFYKDLCFLNDLYWVLLGLKKYHSVIRYKTLLHYGGETVLYDFQRLKE